MTEYKSNSFASKNEESTEKARPVAKKVVSTASIRKKSELRKMVDAFIPNDLNAVKQDIITNIIVPTVRKSLYNILKNTIDILINGEITDKDRGSSTRTRVSYSGYYNSSRNNESRSENTGSRNNGYDYGDIFVGSIAEANDVLDEMGAMIEQYGRASVHNLYECIGQRGNYNDHDFGWTNISRAKVVPDREGYRIVMPTPMHFD